ncbi:ABC transporter permease [Lewinella cohaerens]|uniref:ABC transporter permease n=1 Tax=Lewinella cohaerens TaxID=70995 RepID=UPI00035C9E74|nr:ABC transporter permease [Lewinella cohaerens]
MLKHTLKSILRQLKRQSLFTGIHLLGLSVGLCCAMLLFLYIRHEINYDTHHAAADRIYRVTHIGTSQGDVEYSAGTPYPLVDALRAEVPELEMVSGIHGSGRGIVRIPGKDHYRLEDVYFADGSFLEMFDFGLAQGVDPAVMAAPGKAVLSEETAKMIFGAEDPVGKTIKLDEKLDLTVVGTYEDEKQSHLSADMLVSLASLNEDFLGFPTDQWGNSIGGAAYVRLPEGQTPAQFSASLAALVDKYMNGEEEGVANELWLQPLGMIHFDPRFDGLASVEAIRPVYLWIAGATGLLILLMACFNFVNLSLAQNLSKQQEVGMRKVLGASRIQLWAQYWGEALVLALSAGVVSVLLLQIGLPYLQEKLQQQISYQGWQDYSLIGFVFLITLIISVIAGGYPAWVIARKKANEVLKGNKVVSDKSQVSLRKGLILAQFVITLVMICSAITVSRQLDFIQNKDLGFRQEAILQVSRNETGRNPQLQEEWEREAGVSSVTFSLGAPTSRNNIGSDYYPKGRSPQEHRNRIELKAADERYLENYDLELLAGRFVSAEETARIGDSFPMEGEEWPLVVNETLAKEMGYTNYEEVLDKRIIIGFNNAEGYIVGVTKDFNISSLHDEVAATAILPLSMLYYQIGVKMDPAQIATTLPRLEASWQEFYPDQMFDYSFLEEDVLNQYLAEARTNTLLQGFAGLAIFIACLGLFGLMAIMVRQRRKEIGLRKVLGASVTSLWALLSSDMIRLILVSLLIAGPLAWWLMSNWLNNFAYRISMNIWTIVIGGVALLFIALLTVSGQALRAALTNPVEALRNE